MIPPKYTDKIHKILSVWSLFNTTEFLFNGKTHFVLEQLVSKSGPS